MAILRRSLTITFAVEIRLATVLDGPGEEGAWTAAVTRNPPEPAKARRLRPKKHVLGDHDNLRPVARAVADHLALSGIRCFRRPQ